MVNFIFGTFLAGQKLTNFQIIPCHFLCFAGVIEADNPDSSKEVIPDWVKRLRNYQYELAEPGIKGFNYIINAPTGSGKTWTAAYIIRDHLKKLG